MANDRGFIVYPTYRIKDNRAYVYLFGRLENGESFCTIHETRPYFYIKTVERAKAQKLVPAYTYQDTDFVNMEGHPVTRVLVNIPKDVRPLRDLFSSHGIACFEADIRFAYRYLIDHQLFGSIVIDGRYSKGEFVDREYPEPVLSPSTHFPTLKILSFDIETDMSAAEVYCISLYTEGYQHVFIAKEGKFKHATSCKTEKELLEAFRDQVRRIDPDVIVGWNVIDFDLSVLKRRFDHYKIPFTFGRTDWEASLKITDSYFIDSGADVPGRIVLDGIHLLKMSFIKLQDYKLATAAQTILGEKKLLEGSGRFTVITDYYKNDPQKLIDYNLKDSELVYKIIEKTKVVDLTITRSMLTRMQLDRVNASVASLDSVYLQEMQKRKIVAPTAQVVEGEERIRGGFVREPTPGIYENILVLDFKSLYPSVIRTFNIDPLTFVSASQIQKSEKYITAPNGAHFRYENGILPDLLERLWVERDEAKKNKNTLLSNAVKILMNSFFGVLANPACRFYNLDVANAITYFGQEIIKMTSTKIEEMGYPVIYGDTDSIFVQSNAEDEKKASAIGKEIEEYINSYLKAYVRKHHDRESFLQLQFEKQFVQFFMPMARHGESGAKKRYAGIIAGSDKVSFVGLEFVRRDWTELAKKFQYTLLEKVFAKEKVDEFVRQFVLDLRSGQYDELLVYRKAIRKDVAEYTKTTPPHIQAARKLGKTTTGIIEYVQTKKGPEPLEERKSPIDYEHYIEKQIKPIADSVLVFFRETFENLTAVHRQRSLFEY